MPWKIFCIEEAGIGFGPQNVKKYEINMKKYENNMNFGPRVGLNGWGGANIGKQVILRIL